MNIKTCPKCGISKQHDQFATNMARGDGLSSWCRVCTSAWKSSPEFRQHLRDKRKTNIEHHRELQRKSWSKHREKRCAELREYHQLHREERNAQRAAGRSPEVGKRWRAENRAKVIASKRAFGKTIKGRVMSWWKKINERTINGTRPQWNNKNARYYLNKGIRLEISREQLITLVTDNWDSINQIVASGQIPSIERIDPAGNYSIGNIEFITVKENARRARAKQIFPQN